MKKIGVVVPWFGEKIPGGAEMLIRGLTMHLAGAGVTVEILTTCAKEFASDWNTNFHKEGVTTELGLTVRRFKVRRRNVSGFDNVNKKLLRGVKLTSEEEEIFNREMINSDDLYSYIRTNNNEYSLFLYAPYMFGTTINGIRICPEKSVVVPCFHDESYAYMESFKETFSKVRGLVFNSKPEEILAKKIYDLSSVKCETIGVGVDTDISGSANDFRNKFGINEPFILYAGRKDTGKNVHTLIEYYREFKSRNETNLKLVLIGGGEIYLPKELVDSGDIIDLGFVSVEDKANAYSASLVLCQPSKNESFSLVIMESWLNGRPVMVHEDCEVTKNFVVEANAGFYFKTYYEFEGQINYLLKNNEIASLMGSNGDKYVRENFSWDVVTTKYIKFLKSLAEGES